MEAKKQLVIVPPMSGPLQKLNEVLEGIAVDENIEISIIDDLKELSQFLGSTGQCLIYFSNAKKCASFLQENRFVIAKTHTKVILLTPKEIPAKTLVKFTKIGLTESILENSPPKTLLYKVKLLLRSIKTSTGAEEKELAMKSMGDNNQAAAKGEINAEKIQTEEGEAVNYLAEERAKFKKEQEENAIDYGSSLKGKNSIQEEAIETHWKSKRKKDETAIDLDDGNHKIEDENTTDIDMYYRGKRKGEQLEVVDGEDLYARKPVAEEEAMEDYLKKKKVEETVLDLDPAKKERRQDIYEEEDDYSLKKSKEYEELEAADEPEKKLQLTEEEEEAAKKKEMDELEALFEAAKKRAAEQTEDLGGHYKGKIMNLPEEEEDEGITEEKEYDNTDLMSESEPSFDLDLLPPDEKEKRKKYEEEEEETKRKGFREEINENMSGKDGASDHIETMMMSDIGEDASKKIRTIDTFERDAKKNAQEEEDVERARKKNDDAPLSAADDLFEKKKIYENEDNDKDRDAQTDLDLIGSDDPFAKKNEGQQDEEEDREREVSTNLKLIDGDKENNRAQKEKEDDALSLKKMDLSELQLEKSRNHSHTGKVDKIDTFYRSGENKNKEHDWNLGEQKKNTELALEKGPKRQDETAKKQERVDAGEITIDYRKLKEEFEAISRGEDSGEDGIYSSSGKRKGEDDEEASFKVIELNPVGFDFGIEIVNMLYQKETKPLEFYKAIAEEMITHYKAYPVFYSYKPSDKKHTEAFDSFTQISDPSITDELHGWWDEHKKNETIMSDYFTKTMNTWICRQIPTQMTEGTHWEDVELPSWAANELTDKKVELVFPYFDGVDRMGVALVYFPFGLNPKQEKGIEVTLEMARTILLDTIQRKVAVQSRDPEGTEETENKTEKKKILNMFSGLFNKGNKAS